MMATTIAVGVLGALLLEWLCVMALGWLADVTLCHSSRALSAAAFVCMLPFVLVVLAVPVLGIGLLGQALNG